MTFLGLLAAAACAALVGGKAEVISLIQVQRATFDSFAVEYTFQAGDPGVGQSSKGQLAMSPCSYVHDHVFESMTKFGPRHTVAAWDGMDAILLFVDANAAVVLSGPNAYAGTLDDPSMSWFTDFLRHYPCPGMHGSLDVLAFLSNPDVELAGTELVDGSDCLVFNEMFTPGDGRDPVVVRSWLLDPARGYLPVVQRLFVSTGHLVAELKVTASVEAIAGVHFPVGGTYRSFDTDGSQVGKGTLTVPKGDGAGGHAVWVGAQDDVPFLVDSVAKLLDEGTELIEGK